ncbi:MAG: TetR/AcrR family transcriptional regulator [Dehalococcoidia bacterium]|nr:TetR/AcrR family transcriptional regulator [Dehalococcoidia bacterium]
MSQEKTIAGRKAILEAAELLFAQKGYQAASIDNIAVAARVSGGLVHYHFHSKEDLFMELVKNVMDGFSERLQNDLTSCSTARTKIRATTYRGPALACQNGKPLRVVACWWATEKRHVQVVRAKEIGWP